MNAYRPKAIAVTSCATGLFLAACSAGVTITGSGAPRSPATTSPSAAASSSAPAGPADAVSVAAPVGSFPVPPGARVLENLTCGNTTLIDLNHVTPAAASRFYPSALSRAGYKITDNTMISERGPQGSAAEIEFTGHGYKGTIIAVSGLGALASAGPSPVSVPSSLSKAGLAITLSPSGSPACNLPGS